jgi:hypothetical protein
MRLIDEITQDRGFETGSVRGYSDEEIHKMESFYGIKVSGDLRRFFAEFGRSSGFIGFEGFIVAYSGYYAQKTPLKVSSHVATQLGFKDELMKHARPFCTGKPFLFSIENETQYFFVRTTADEPLRIKTPEDDYSQLSTDPDIVYQFDENQSTVENTGLTLKDYLFSRIQPRPLEKGGAGEMIVI